MSEGQLEVSLRLLGGPPYGFRIAGGDGEAVTVARVRNGSKAEQAGLKEDDVLLVANGVICRNLSYDTVFDLTEYDPNQLPLVVLRGRNNVQGWKEASERMKGRMRLLDEGQVKEMLKDSYKKFEVGSQVFNLQMPKKSSILSSSPVNVMVDGNGIRITGRPSEVVHVPLEFEGNQKVATRNGHEPGVIRNEDSYSYSTYSSLNDAPLSKTTAYSSSTLPKITRTFVSQNNLRIGNSIAEKIDSALNPSIFYGTPQRHTMNNNIGALQTNFKVTQNHISDDSGKPVMHNAVPNKEHIIPVRNETPSKFQSVANVKMTSSSPNEDATKKIKKPTEDINSVSHKLAQGYLIKQNDQPIKKSQESIDFPSTKMFSDYLPQTSLNPQALFKPDWEQAAKPVTDYPFMNISNDFQDKVEVNELTEREHTTPSYAAPTQHYVSDCNSFKTQPPSNLSSTPKPLPTPQLNHSESLLGLGLGENKVAGTQKDAMNNKAALAKNVALSVMSEANQNSKGQKMFLMKRQNSEKWTLQGPDPPKPAPKLTPLPEAYPSNGHSHDFVNVKSMDERIKNSSNEKEAHTIENQPHYQDTSYHPSFHTQPQFNSFPPPSFQHQPPMDPYYNPYNHPQPWSPPSYSYTPHHASLPPNHYPYQPTQSHSFYQPYQPVQHYQPSHPPNTPYSPPYYPPFPQTQPHMNPHFPNHQPYLPPTHPHPPHPTSHLSHPPTHPASHVEASQDIVDYCDL